MTSVLAPYFVGHSSISNFNFCSKYVGWLYVPSEGHITTYGYLFAQERKRPLNYQVEQHLRGLNSYICLELLSLPRNFNFSPKQCQMVTSTISSTCHHEVNLARVHSFNNISFINKLGSIKSIQTQ